MSHSFRQVDVFSPVALGGNPVAVVHGADDLDAEQMQRFARWTNLSETTFLLTPTTSEADYRVRIFTPSGELPFAGHPTLGSAHAWLEGGGVPSGTDVIQECGVGLVRLGRGERLAFAAPPMMKAGPLTTDELATVARSLGVGAEEILDSNWVANGPQFVAVQLRDAARVLAVEPDLAAPWPIEIGVFGRHPSGSESDIEVRVFFRGNGISEDPITGSFNAGLAMWQTGNGSLPPSYVAAQGTVIGRTGRVFIDTDADGTIWVGGDTLTTVAGSVSI